MNYLGRSRGAGEERSPGRIACAVGAAVGALMLGAAGERLGTVYADAYSEGLGGIVPVVVSATAGLFLGAVAGAWLALRLTARNGRRATLIAMSFMMPFLVVAAVGAGIILDPPRSLRFALVLLATSVAAAGARWLTSRHVKHP